MIDDTTAAVVLIAMALVTLLTKWLGLMAMSFAPLTPRVETALQALAGSVLVALVAPAAIQGGAAYLLAVGVAGLSMALTGRTLLSLLLGVAAAAGLRAAGLG